MERRALLGFRDLAEYGFDPIVLIDGCTPSWKACDLNDLSLGEVFLLYPSDAADD